MDESARDFRIPEITQHVFYAMVVNDAVELGVTSRDVADALVLALEGLLWDVSEFWLGMKERTLWSTQLRRLANLEVDPESAGDQEENSESSDAPPPSSDEE